MNRIGVRINFDANNGDGCQPVLTFNDLAYFHNETPRFYADVFERNKEKFAEGEDFFVFSNEKQKVACRKEPGSVYVAKDPATGHVKIGKTTTTIEKRIGTLNSGRPVPIEEYESFECSDCGLAERVAHETLSDYRVHREWFSTSMSKAKRIVKQVTEEVNNGNIRTKKENTGKTRRIIFLSASGYRKMYDICVFHDKASAEQFGYVMLNYFGRAVAENKEFALMLLDKSREDQIRLINDNYDRLKEELLRDYSATEAQRKTSLI